MQKILVPIDGSPIAHKALGVACDIAKARGGKVVLLHSLLHDKEPEELHRLADLEGAPKALHEALDAIESSPAREINEIDRMRDHNAVERPVPDEVLRDIGACILQVAGQEAETAGVESEAMELHDGPAAEGILDCARSQGVEAIVMGRRGLRNIEAIAFGSVSQAVGAQAPCTCITVM